MPLIPDVPGINKKSAMTAVDVLRGKQVGQNVIVVGGGLVGCEIAFFLAMAGKLYGLSRYRRMLPGGWVKWLTRLLLTKARLPSFLRKKIRIIEASEDVASGITEGVKQFIFEAFSKYEVEINPGLMPEEVTEGGIIAVDVHGKKYNFKADSVIFTNFVANRDLLEGLEKANIAVHTVGDCIEPRRIYEAIHEGHMVARNL